MVKLDNMANSANNKINDDVENKFKQLLKSNGVTKMLC